MKAGFTNFSFVAKDTQTFQHIAKFVHGTTIPLTTFAVRGVLLIVTAAIHWGFDSQLRLAANRSS